MYVEAESPAQQSVKLWISSFSVGKPVESASGVANPTAIMLAGAMMLDYMEQHDKAKRLRRTVRHVVGQGEIVTPDLGGRASTTEFTDELIRHLTNQ